MTILARLLVSSALVATSLAATAAPVRYALDPVHTRVLFA
ncbi:polyisoprenoid-binding protein, partial [Xanthomonas perforans]|nr:polyisoprenoid-binding protein [Xanthomonas perforans]